MTKSTNRPPKGLSPEAAAWWTSIITSFEIDDSAGRLQLQVGMEAFDQMRAAEAVLSKEGLVVKDRFGQPRQHPASLIQRDSRTALMRALKSLNLDVEIPGPVGRPPKR